MLAPSDTPNAIPDSNDSSTQLLLARRKAQYLPCSMLALADKPDGLHVSGPAQAGPELDRILGELRGLSHLTDRIIRIGRFACAPIAALVRQSWESTPSLPFAIQLDQRKIIGGSRIGIDVTTTLPAVYIDLYQKDGSVRHLQVTSRSAAKTSATWVTSQPTGSLLVTAIGSERLLDIGTRPEVEPAARYLEVLQAELKRTTTRIQSDLVAVPPQAPLPLAAAQPYKCANTATNPESDGGFLSSVKQMFGLGQSGTIKIVNPQVKASVAAHSRATAACGSPGDHKSSR
jgi:hypothetical protein